jgi:Domain of unknown function (DUF4396)
MLSGVMLLWFLLTAMAVIFVAWDIRSTPESPVLKAGFILLTCYTGPFGAFLYVLGCREPLPGLHEQYIAVRWRQVLGSTMHCVAGDGVGILAGAVIGAWIQLPRPAELVFEYTLGFAFGWTIFQALFMRDMVGGSYSRSLRSAFLPELLSMNFLMAGMIPVMTFAMKATPNGHNPLGPAFWFVMSMSLLAGFVVAYPMNWWLVANNLKHGMMTVGRHDQVDQGKSTQVHQLGHPSGMAGSGHATNTAAISPSHEPADHSTQQVSAGRRTAMTLLSFVVFAIALAIGLIYGG